MRQKLFTLCAVLAFAAVAATGAGAATYPFTTSEITGTEIVTGTCLGWGLDPDPIGASSCTGTTITRTASASDLVLTNTGIAALGKTYATSMTITRTAGDVTLAVGGTSGTARASSATFTQDITAIADGAVTLTFSADFAGTITTTVSVKKIQGSSTYTPNTVTTPYSTPDSGGTIPDNAVEAVLSVETYPIRYLYNATPTATVGVLLPAGSVLKWGPDEFAKFKAIKFIDTASGAATVSIVYGKGSE